METNNDTDFSEWLIRTDDIGLYLLIADPSFKNITWKWNGQYWDVSGFCTFLHFNRHVSAYLGSILKERWFDTNLDTCYLDGRHLLHRAYMTGRIDKVNPDFWILES